MQSSLNNCYLFITLSHKLIWVNYNCLKVQINLKFSFSLDSSRLEYTFELSRLPSWPDWKSSLLDGRSPVLYLSRSFPKALLFILSLPHLNLFSAILQKTFWITFSLNPLKPSQIQEEWHPNLAWQSRRSTAWKNNRLFTQKREEQRAQCLLLLWTDRQWLLELSPLAERSVSNFWIKKTFWLAHGFDNKSVKWFAPWIFPLILSL